MPNLLSRICAASAVIFVALPVLASEAPLHEGWKLQSACTVSATGQSISTSAFQPQGWITATVPSTVLAAQVAAGVFKDPYYAMNLRSIPGTSYPIGTTFSNEPMPQDSPYRCGWWYRKVFHVSSAQKGKTLWLYFGGINYSAEIWLNGKLVASRDQVAGAYRTYEFNVTDKLTAGADNVVAVETFAPTPLDLGINWVDWNPSPSDKDMGLWGPVSLRTSGPVSVRSPLATTHFTDASLHEADLTVYGELRNSTDKPIHGTAIATIGSIHVQQAVDLPPNQQTTVAFTPDKFSELRIHNPRIWWPWQMGPPNLQTLTISFRDNGQLSDQQSVQFGIREVTSELDDGHRLFRVNGKRILIRGGGWSQDMLLRQNPDRLRDQFQMVRDMRLNTIRLEGKLDTADFFRLADQKGVLVMLGWCCCDQWEHWNKWTPENMQVATASLRSQMLRLRSHPSLLVWLNGSDGPPPSNVESAYLNIEAETHWPNPTLSSASARPTSVSGQSGVKMSGPYDYVAPSYWLVDANRTTGRLIHSGGAWGFNTETSPGPAIPTISSIKKIIPADQLWPPNETWSYHYGGGGFKQLTAFNSAMNATYGPANTLQDYVRIAQTMSYNNERAMFEAYGRNKYRSTGVIQWMLNNAWPSMIWHLYDYYLDAGGGYYGTKKALEPVHVQYSYDDHSVYVVNSTYQPMPELDVTAKVFDTGLKQVASQHAQLTVAADASTRALSLPASAFAGDNAVHFVELLARNKQGTVISRNFYWVPSQLTTFDWGKGDYTHTPALTQANMQQLRSLHQAKLQARAARTASGVQVTLHNSSDTLAFQVAVAAQDNGGNDIDPTLWSDNYIEVMPGESRTLTATFAGHVPGRASISITGWNIPSVTVPLK